MTEQQYRVHACGNTEPHEPHEFRGTYRKPSLPGVKITETFRCEGIELPVPTEPCLSNAHHGEHEWGGHEGKPATGYWCEGFDASDEAPHPPTREQIYQAAQDAAIYPLNHRERTILDAVLALIQNGADR